MKFTMDRKLAYAAATDAANRSMRAHDRFAWDEDDYDIAVAAFARLWPSDPTDEIEHDPRTAGATL